MNKMEYSYSSKLLREKKEYEFELNVSISDIKYIITGIAVEVNGEIESLKVTKAKYQDPFGDMLLNHKSLNKLKSMIKKNIVGNVSSGFVLNKPFKYQLEMFVPE